jgi:hypothetical protein
MKAVDEKPSDDLAMRDDYSDYSDLPFEPGHARFAAYRNAPIVVIQEDGTRHQKASLLLVEEELEKYALSDFATIVEALKIIAHNRGAEQVQSVLARCEYELSALKAM